MNNSGIRLSLAPTALLVALILAGGSVVTIARDALVAARFGASGDGDAYFLGAYITIILITVLVTESVAPATVVVLSSVKGSAAQRVSSLAKIVGVAGSPLLIVMLVLVLSAPWLVQLLAPGLDRASSSAATQATIAAAPALVLLGLAWLVGAYLNAAGRYIVPAMITGVVAIGACLPLLAKRPSPAEAAFGWSIGAAMAFALMLAWAIRASRTPADAAVEALDRSALERTRLLATPLMMLAAVQGSIEIADRIIASHLGLGAITMIALAKKGLHLPSTILVAAVGAVLLPFLSRRETDDERADGFAQMLNLSLFFLLPTAAVLIVNRYEIVRLLFGRGAFGDDDVRVTAALLGLYALALIPVNIAMLLQRSLSTLGTARVALVPYAVSMAGYVLAAWFGSQQIGIRALPVSFAAASCGYAVALLVMLHRRLHFPMPRLLWPAVMTLLATALCSLAMIVVQRALDTSDVISLTATVLSGGLAYVFAISWLAHPAAGDIMAAIRRLRTGTSPTTQPALRVLFDMTFGTGHSGTARYVLSMKRELERIEGVEVIARRSTRLHRGPRLVRVGLNGVMHLTWTMLVVPFIAWRNQVDVIHVTMIAPLHAPCPVVVTMHDALDFYPALRPSRIWSLYMRLVGVPAARRAQAVLTGSDAGAREIAELIGIDRARLVVVPYGSTLSETDVCPSQAPHRPTPGDYVLAFGDFSRRKNLQTAITAVELVRDLGHEVDMVVVGSMPADAAKGKPWLHAKAAVGDRELAELYRGARAVLIPSRHEGFGLPAAEALGLGTPVVASDIPALREIGGTWARFASPDDPDGFARELRAILDDPGRDVMASHQRPLQVSWEVTARRTAAVYEQIVQMYPRRRAWVSTVLS